MTMPARECEAYVNDGNGGKRLIRPGDEVTLLPVNLREQDEEHGDYFARKEFDCLREWLGDGPFTVSRIGRWPCGKIMLYLKGAKSPKPGAYASDFM
ncbi:MAG: hypothetical protein AAB490_01625 [Patescibacteria group bacterium]